ncbi:hypothetical protein [Chromobacterium sphagni]|uniref:hypothetical protein n=1 Tax=Chromobacterium sphagni TaxID=1903179 RepID=UPI0011144002|nr:hypothetical protein [Chromobacterium sphagni]
MLRKLIAGLLVLGISSAACAAVTVNIKNISDPFYLEKEGKDYMSFSPHLPATLPAKSTVSTYVYSLLPANIGIDSVDIIYRSKPLTGVTSNAPGCEISFVSNIDPRTQLSIPKLTITPLNYEYSTYLNCQGKLTSFNPYTGVGVVDVSISTYKLFPSSPKLPF